MASEDDRRLHDVGVAALAAIAQYPHSVNDQSHSLLVSEVVHAMTGSSIPIHQHSFPHSPLLETIHSPPDGDPSPPMQFDANSMPSESEALSPLSQSDFDLDMEGIVQDLIERTASWPNIATIMNESDIEKDMVMDYDPSFEDHTSPSTTPDDDFEDFIRFYPDEEEYYRQENLASSPEATMRDVNFEEFYQPVDYEAAEVGLPEAPGTPPMGPFPGEEDPDVHPASIIHTTTHERNLTIDEFIQRWMVSINIIPNGFHSEHRVPPQLRPLSKLMSWTPPPDIHRPGDYEDEIYDLQQIPWTETLKVKRSDARALRDTWYTSYHNVPGNSHNPSLNHLPQDELFFREKSMHTTHKATVEHFQLRNLMSVPTYNTVNFSSHSKVYSWTPAFNDLRCLIDLSRSNPESGFLGPVKISSMKTAHGLTIAGGFCGEYALQNADASGSGAKGLVTPDPSDGITNHVDIIPSRSNKSPICVFASNDRHLRTLDCETNIFLSDQKLSRPINCTATSPDNRLRVVIGDSPDAWVIEADTGRPVHPLRGHKDFGFACAWSPDMRHIATSNQDKTVIIWDARTWKVLEKIDSDVAGYRSLRFSPVGGGPRTLLCAEPADRISIIDAQLYQSRQVHDFFGEIGGADFSPDGGSLWVANTDPHFGGFLQYERREWGRSFGLVDLPNEWASEADLDSDGRCVLSERERKLRFMKNFSDEEHDMFVL
ncbi:hypothetical protein N7532_010010 [Penicillium argentinense]|uniref:WD repeat protein n=1 Tax=Penicillium argentinense TaxID=1131581 RepID=A0A9W9EP30_9EURO|nr:uncharacterized protein N7532_010010 [Penicillium argentinense]KAJ5085239.1 hypothetical protein N7532_010010 [Penicillium argentinense]